MTLTSTVFFFLFFILPEAVLVKLSFTALLPVFLLYIICDMIAHRFFKTYESLWRYAKSKEYLTLFFDRLTGFFIFSITYKFLLPLKVSLVQIFSSYGISLLAMFVIRLGYRQFREHGQNGCKPNSNLVAILGAGEAGVRLLEALNNNPNSNYEIICFIDDSIEKIGKVIHGVEVKGPISDIADILSKIPIKEIIFAIPSATALRKKEILELCSKQECRVRILPGALSLLQNENLKNPWNTIRDIQIEELLGREQIVFEDEAVKSFLSGKVILVTGGGGSIGSELCRQIAKAEPKQLIILDIYENNAYEIQQELFQIYRMTLDVKIEIASIRDFHKINYLFRLYRPAIVFHAAAHKHVPLMEDCPEEAVKNNILGTYHVVKAADTYQVEKFVLISTDKAVNPTNVMGASKRFCEMLLQSMKGISKTEFVAVRFGNVLGSNGSVIPLFQKQIAAGGPVTITDKRIVRYFMTITEAAQLVLQAGSMASSSEIYILDMGQPVKILDLAENLIRLSGYVPYTEIPIIESGLRPGEKLYEELLTKSEELIATSNHKIFIERQKNISHKELIDKLELLQSALLEKSNSSIKTTLKEVVPTYCDPEEVNQGIEQ
nr:nucleoside-diphosphate sugar epimerase/dehydratase [Anaerocolumna cellulosilytica]